MEGAKDVRATHLLTHIKVVQQTGQLVRLIGELTTSQTYAEAFDAMQRCLDEGPLLSCWKLPRRSLWQSEAEITKLIVKELHCEHPFEGQEDTRESKNLLLAVRQYVFGACAGRMQLPLMILVYSQSFCQAAVTRVICTGIMLALVSPKNCCEVLNLAEACDAHLLTSFCYMVAQQFFGEASQSEGFCKLNLEQLLALIGNDNLQVSQELEVFWSVARWIEADLSNQRQGQIAHILEKGVRLELLDRTALSEIDAHPLVIQSEAASVAVAKAYMQACYGSFILGPGQPKRLRKQSNLADNAAHSPMSVASCCADSPESRPSAKVQEMPDESLQEVNKLSEPSKKSDTSLAAFSHTKAQTQLKRKRVLADTGTPNRFVTPSYRPGQPESKKAVQAENSGVISSMHTGFEPADQKPPSKRRLLFMTDA